MKSRITILCIIFISFISFGQSVSLLNSYKIPTYSYHNLRLYGQDFFNYLKTNYLEAGNKSEMINVKTGLEEGLFSQSPNVTRKMYGLMTFDFNQLNNINNQGLNSITDSSIVQFLLATSNSWYFLNNNRGLFFFIDPAFYYTYNFKQKVNTHTIDIPFGVGYGRIIGVKNVVQAYIIAREIGADLSDEVLLKIATLIEKYNNGYYYAKFRDDAKIEFYKDIAALTDKPDKAFKIDQILSSSLYKTSQRFVGWQVKAGVNFTYLDVQTLQSQFQSITYSTAEDLIASVEYALPVDFDKQFLASLTYSSNLNDEIFRMPIFNASAQFSIDHTYNWATTLFANYSVAFINDKTWELIHGFPLPNTGNTEKMNLGNVSLGARTDFVLLNSFSLYASLEYLNQEFRQIPSIVWSPLTQPVSKTETIMFHLGFSIYIL